MNLSFPETLDQGVDLLVRFCTQRPWTFLTWPAAAMVVGTLLGILSSQAATRLAVVPRTRGGLVGIVTAPFVHANFEHLFANLVPFVVLGFLVLRHGQSHFLGVTLSIALVQGLLLWLMGRNAAHVGMSGVIFGYFGYLLTLAWFTRATPDLAVAAGVLLFYGGMVGGLAHAKEGTSWEGHLLGLVAGVGVAWLLHRG